MAQPDIRLHYNRDNGIYSARCVFTRETISASTKHFKPSVCGAYEVLPTGEVLLFTQRILRMARAKKQPLVVRTVTNWPRLKLVKAWFFEEVLKHD